MPGAVQATLILRTVVLGFVPLAGGGAGKEATLCQVCLLIMVLEGRLSYCLADTTGPWLVWLPVVVSCLETIPSVTGAEMKGMDGSKL